MPFATLPSKPNAPIYYDLLFHDKITGTSIDVSDPAANDDILIVFINGLIAPCAQWRPVVDLLLHPDSTTGTVPNAHELLPAFSSGTKLLPPGTRILLYDRYGQGETVSRDPLDSAPGAEPGYGHDLADATADLRELLDVVLHPSSAPTTTVTTASDSFSNPRTKPTRLLLVGHSIGAHIVRLFAAACPGQVSASLLLDSNVGNAELTDFMPDPGSPGFRPEQVVVEGECSLEQYVAAYGVMKRRFHSGAKNSEGLDRRNTRELVPDPSRPKLRGPEGKDAWLVVAGHDPEAFARESLETIQVPRSVTARFVEPGWLAYNKGLTLLSAEERFLGLEVAPGCGHFIQRDNPGFVAIQVMKLLEKMRT